MTQNVDEAKRRLDNAVDSHRAAMRRLREWFRSLGANYLSRQEWTAKFEEGNRLFEEVDEAEREVEAAASAMLEAARGA